jgi:hypothetical protein
MRPTYSYQSATVKYVLEYKAVGSTKPTDHCAQPSVDVEWVIFYLQLKYKLTIRGSET